MSTDFRAMITEDELRLLAWLHEYAVGFGVANSFRVPDVRRVVGLDALKFNRAITYLDEHGLAGCRYSESVEAVPVVDQAGGAQVLSGLYIAGVYLTGLGEDYMRTLEQQPGIAAKIAKTSGRLTLAAVKEVYGVAREVVVGVLTELTLAQVRGTSGRT